MSATGRGKGRETNDYYATPAWTVDRLFECDKFIEHLATVDTPMEEQAWLEPGVGEGAIIDAVEASGIKPFAWDTVDVVDTGDLTFHGSFLDYKTRERYSCVIGNPPYLLAQEFITKALELADVVVFLLRLNLLGSEERADWWRQMSPKPDIFVLPNRPVFALNKQGKPGVDATEYAWFVWSPTSAGRWTILNSTSKEERGEHSKKVIAAGVPVYTHAEDCVGIDADGETTADKSSTVTCTCLPPLKDLLETLDELKRGRPMIVGSLYETLIEDAPAHGGLTGSGELGKKRVSTHEQLAAVVMELV